ncbi:MAG: sigma-54-dependent Fis family transcriptional regulator [Acidobacteria bacterium]|nr:sigma-54-dependent Fis family transcriptional regulator [Acidobacteriota bacterium]
MTDPSLARILVIDDEKDMLETCRKIFSLHSYKADTAERGEAALSLCQQHHYDLAIIDLKMPDMDGMEVMKRLLQIRKDQLIIFITAFASVESAIQAVRGGAFDFLRKPFKMDELILVVERALRFKALQDENQRLQRGLQESFQVGKIVGKSPVLQEALIKLRKVSEVEIPVLICGESGTGKELFARTIHANSRRREKMFLAVDCASLPEPLLEGELFGYEKGAFTGAVQTKRGLLEVASGGTLMLDEIGEMPLNLQVKLLRALQEGCVRRLGGDQERPFDIRLLCATHRDLETMVNHGSFREDLYYRINVVRIDAPPLRERQGDVHLLATHFFESFRSKVSKRLEGISAAALLILESYDWPGNVRELRHAIERACTLTESTHIVPEDLPPSILAAVEEKETVTSSSDFARAKREIIEDFERKYVARMLSHTAGNVTEAARLSGLSRPAYHRLMSKYQITSSTFKN